MGQTLLVGERLALLDAHQDLVRLVVAAVHVVTVVRGDDGDAGLAADLAVGVVHLRLLVEAVRHDLEEVAAGLEEGLVLLGDLTRARDALPEDRLRDLAAQAGREADQTLAAILEERLVDAGVVVEALEEPHRVQVREVLVALLVARQENEVVVFPVGTVLAVIPGHIGLGAEDRLHARGLGALEEVHSAEHVAVVGHGHGLHAVLEDAGKQIVEADGPVEKTVRCVQMEVRELARRGHRVAPSRYPMTVALIPGRSDLRSLLGGVRGGVRDGCTERG